MPNVNMFDGYGIFVVSKQHNKVIVEDYLKNFTKHLESYLRFADILGV